MGVSNGPKSSCVLPRLVGVPIRDVLCHFDLFFMSIAFFYKLVVEWGDSYSLALASYMFSLRCYDSLTFLGAFALFLLGDG